MDQQKYKELFKEVDERFAEVVQEFSDSRNALNNDQRFIRTRLLMAFSFLEVICGLYNAYFDRQLENRALLKEWLEKYCVTDSNLVFKSHPYIRMLSVEQIYKFRNSIIHAFALPEPENNVSIMVPNGSESSEVIIKMDEGFRKLGHTVAFVSADSLLQLFLAGYTLMHPDIFKDLTIATQSDFDSLQRVVKEFGRRGARGIPLAQ